MSQKTDNYEMLQTEKTSQPWWKYGYMWLVVGGPLVVVIAGFITLWIAVNGADPVIDANYYRNGLEMNKQLQHPEKSMAPAQKMRNYSTTPEKDLPSLAPAE